MKKEEMDKSIENLIFALRSGEKLKIVMKYIIAQCTDKNDKYIQGDFKMNDRRFAMMYRATYNEKVNTLMKWGFIARRGRGIFSGTDLLEHFVNSDYLQVFHEEFK